MMFKRRGQCLGLSLLPVLLLAGSCASGSDPFETALESPELPVVSLLDAVPPRELSYTNTPDHLRSGNEVFLSSPAPDVVITADDAMLTAPAGSLCYAIYQFGSFYYLDEVVSVTVEANTPAGFSDEDVQFYVGVGDYYHGTWKFTEMQSGPGIREIEFPQLRSYVSPGQNAYICIVAYDGKVAEIENLTGHFKLVGRVPDHVQPYIPNGELINRPVRLRFDVVDAEDYAVFGFTRTGTISSTNPGLTVIAQPDFTEGYGDAIVQFNSVGSYDLTLSDLGAPVDGLLGTIEAYDTQLDIYEITLSSADWRALRTDPYTDEYKIGVFTINGTQYPDIRVRFRGGASRDFKKKSWKVKLNTLDQYDDPLWGYTRKTLNLNAAYIDQSLMRDKLSYDLAQDLGLLSPRARFVHLRVNDAFQGVYIDVENPRSDWLVSMGYNDQGTMYKAAHSNMEELPTPADYLAGADPPFEKEMPEDSYAGDLALFIHNLNSWNDSEFHDQLQLWLDTGKYADYLAFNSAISQTDAIYKNYYLYNDILGTGKWVVFPWDNDLSWGRNHDGVLGLFDPVVYYDTPLDYGVIPVHNFGNVLVTRFLEDPQFNNDYTARLNWVLDNVFTEGAMLARIDAYEALVGPDAYADIWRWTPGDLPWSDYVEELRGYVRQRIEFLDTELGR